MRALLLILLCCAPVLAAEALDDAETRRWARRALLNPDVRAPLKAGVGEPDDLTAVRKVGTGAWLLSRDATRVLALFDGRACVAAHVLQPTGTLSVHELRVGEARLLAVDDMQVGHTERTLFAISPEWPLVHRYTESREQSLNTRRAREVTTTRLHTGADGELLLTTTIEIRRDEQPLEDTRSTATLRLDLTGKAHARVSGHEPGIADWLRAARRLDREGLPRAALPLARRALEAARVQNLPDDDARVLDSHALIHRLKSRTTVVER